MKTMLLLVLLAVVPCRAEDTNQPVSLRYVRESDLEEKVALRAGTIFWVTNHTAYPQTIFVFGIQTNSGSNWVDVPLEKPKTMYFSAPVSQAAFAPSYPIVLHPRSAGYASAQIEVPPAGTTWRVKAIAQRPRDGLETTAQDREIKQRLSSAGVPAELLTNQTFVVDTSVSVLSEEVIETPARAEKP